MIERTFNKDKINSVIKHLDIWERISEKGQSVIDFEAPLKDEFHYLFSDGMLFILHPEGEGSLRIHANVLPYKRKFAEEAAQQALDYGFNLGAKRIVAKIPTKYGSVYGFALKMGMIDEGLIEGDHFLSVESKR